MRGASAYVVQLGDRRWWRAQLLGQLPVYYERCSDPPALEELAGWGGVADSEIKDRPKVEKIPAVRVLHPKREPLPRYWSPRRRAG